MTMPLFMRLRMPWLRWISPRYQWDLYCLKRFARNVRRLRELGKL